MTLLRLLEVAATLLIAAILMAVVFLAFGVAVAYAPDAARWVFRRLAGRHRPAPASTDESPREPEGEVAPPWPPDLGENGDLWPDVEQALAWYRSALEERVPAEGAFDSVAVALPLASRRLWRLTLHLAIGELEDGDPGAHLRYLDIKAASTGGGDMSTDVGLGTNAELIAEIDDGTTAAAIAKFLDRAAREIWRGGTGERDERPVATETGSHVASASPPDLGENADLWDDVKRALAWYRSALEERVPAEGEFEPVTAVLPLTTRRVQGLRFHLEIAGLKDGYTSEHPRWLGIEVSDWGGRDISTDVGVGTNAELIAEIDDGTTAAAIARFLDRVSRELPLGSAGPGEEHEAGLHVSPPPSNLGEDVDLWPDIERALQWYRTTLEERVPKRGEFEPASREMLMLARRVSGLIVLLEIGAVNEADPAESLRYLAVKAYFSNRGGYMRTELGLGSNAELLEEIDDGTTAAAMAALLDQASRDESLWYKPPPPGPPGDVVAELTPDIQRAVEWYRTTLEERVPAEDDFAPVVSITPLTARRLRGLTLHLTVRPFHSEYSPQEALRLLDGKVSSGGGSISIDQGVGTKAELIRALGNGTTARGLVRLLDRASRDLWRGSDLPPEDRAARIAAGRHAALPTGPDCERFSPETLPGLLGPHEDLYDTEHHSISLIRCEHCGQMFVQEYVEVWDDGWIFWARVSEEEAELIRQDLGWSAALIQSRRHITRPPQGNKPMYWSDGAEHVLRMGPRAGW